MFVKKESQKSEHKNGHKNLLSYFVNIYAHSRINNNNGTTCQIKVNKFRGKPLRASGSLEAKRKNERSLFKTELWLPMLDLRLYATSG